MEFVLHYRGDLKSNGTAQDKDCIRKLFHRQLKNLWDQPPLKYFKEILDPIAPLFAKHLNFLAELEITLLRPELPGSIIRSGGDVDNRLKTLLDALAMPSQAAAMPRSIESDTDESPFFRLLEDDNLITKVSVQRHCLLESVASTSEVECTILVRTQKLIKERGFGGLDGI